ncbi:MAG: TetR/AcrR family transcriptional regulator [Chloroflexi bacterium]|nr:TetR/AcrR family transcriptional regulator [Chloroflexota bacterium]
MTNQISAEVTTSQAAEIAEEARQPATRGTKKSMTRERLLDAALELFAERGFEATSTKLIAQQAGVPHGLIHYHFGTKHNLLASLLAERSFFPEIEARFAAARAGTDPRSALIEVCTGFFESHRCHKPLARVMENEGQLDPEMRAVKLQFVDRVLKLLAEFLEDSCQQGAFRALDAEMVAQALLYTLAMNVRHREVAEPRAYCERLVDALVSKEA